MLVALHAALALAATSGNPCIALAAPSCSGAQDEPDDKCCELVTVKGRRLEATRECGSGSSIGGCDYEVYPSNGGPHLTSSYEYPFNTFLAVMPLDSSFFASDGSFYRAALRSVIRYPFQERDGSLKWLLETIGSHRVLRRGVLVWKAAFSPIWIKGEIETPSTYTVELAEPEWNKRRNRLISCDRMTDSEDACRRSRGAFLFYMGHNHRRRGLQQKAHTVDGTELWTTAHGVIERRGDEYAWVFVGDARLGGGPAKLRWPSVLGAVIAQRLVFVEWGGGPAEHAPYSIVVSNPDTGHVGMLNPSALKGSIIEPTPTRDAPLECAGRGESEAATVFAHRFVGSDLELDYCSKAALRRARVPVQQVKAALAEMR